MKKHLTVICAVSLAAVSVFTLAACSSTENSTALYSNWHRRTEYSGIQGFVIDDGEVEELVYDITLQEDSGYNTAYHVELDEGGKLVTRFYADRYDWSDSGIPEEYRTDAVEYVYVYTTSFEVTGNYVLDATGETVPLIYKMDTECWFRPISGDMNPVYSRQYTHSTVPYSYTPIDPELMSLEYDYEYEVFYDYECDAAISVYTDSMDESLDAVTIYDLSDLDYPFFDSAAVYVLCRALNYNYTYYYYADLLVPVENGVSTYYLSASEGTLSFENDSKIIDALAGAGYISWDETINYFNVIITNTGTTPGTAQNVWYAAVEDTKNNTCRSTMLKLYMPLSYSLGNLEFTLCEVVSHFSI